MTDSFVVAAVAGLLVGGFLAWWAGSRRRQQAVAVARAEGETLRAKVEERLALREEALAEARGALAEATRRLESAAARESELRARLAESDTRLAEEREQAAAAERRLGESFANLANRALEANAESFLRQAKQSFETLQASASGDLEQRRQAVEALLAPIQEQLAKYDLGVRELERAREQAYGTLSEQVRAMLSTQERLQAETGNLVKALRAPQVRGRWGEMTLKRAVEFAGLVDHVDFVEQESVAGDDATLRPDLVVRLPGGRKVVVDAKAPLAAYLDAVEARDEDTRLRFLADHARQVRDHVRKLSAKSYWSQFEEAPDFVVLFLPGETFFSAALEQDPSLIDDAFGESVVLATPTTLVALLKSIAYGWRQEQLAHNAREIAAAARELHERVRVFSEHFAGVGRGLAQALKGYNNAAGSLTSRVLPQGRRLEELGAGGSRALVEPEPIDAAPRELPAGDGGDPPPPAGE
ncbi:MAG: DNA recombination protein RmuC [Thermoanaerobaculia bacterium]|nr:DNA recombination protein RmuC [Thermoanaerobaculia bacterium]